MRVLKYIIFAVLLALLQTTVLPYLEIFGAVPDILLIFVVAASLYESPGNAAIVGLMCGILADSLSSSLFGFNSVSFSYIGFLVSFLKINYFQTSGAVHLFFTLSAEFVHLFTYWFFGHFIWGRINFFAMIFNFIMPKLIYTLAVSYPLYKLYVKIYRRKENSAN